MALRFLLTVLVVLALPFIGLLVLFLGGMEKTYQYRQKHHVRK
jgi:hypothetical protein